MKRRSPLDLPPVVEQGATGLERVNKWLRATTLHSEVECALLSIAIVAAACVDPEYAKALTVPVGRREMQRTQR
jgi:hypothetical protein